MPPREKSSATQKYLNLSEASGIRSYRMEKNAIVLEFEEGHFYRYSVESAGAEHVENLKKLAVAGRGLATYVSQHVKDRYESKW